MNQLPILISNRFIRLTGNLFKILSYPFHWVLPNVRFEIPSYSPAKVKRDGEAAIPRVIWQTNFTNKCTLPMYLNYLFNRLMSLNCDYRYVSTEERDIYLKKHASLEIYDAYSRLTDGAAQADMWRLFVLYTEGGVYMDIDATLVWPLDRVLGAEKKALYVKVSKNTEITNYFIASKPKNKELKDCVYQVVKNINNYDPKNGVYNTTGPAVLNMILKKYSVNTIDRKFACIQGSFTNEYFQYMDKPRGKWIHQDSNKLVKK
ncbi:glycosyltransferase family 32 protein [Vibrio sp. TRT 1302]|uniref:glycosyltransferase family 32 protein n=1 Tax=Vibrio sp. TRT 1302 TaxID=3418504 RepID=UPI003CED58C9